MISYEYLDNRRIVPISLPQAELRRNSTIVLAALRLAQGAEFRIGWLGVKIISQLNAGNPVKVTSALGRVYVGVYSGNLEPTGLPSTVLSLDGEARGTLNFRHTRKYSVSQDYSIALVNNTTDTDFEVVVTGAMSIL